MKLNSFYKIKNSKVILFFSIFILYQCAENASSDTNCVDIERAINNDVKVSLDTFADSFDIIELETCDESLLPRNSYILYADDKDIIIESADYIMRFDAKGNFKNKIGVKGKGVGSIL